MAMTSFQAAKKIVWNEDRFSDGLMFAKLMLGVEKLFEDQVKSLRQFFHGKHLYFSAPTGYGKSLIFQAIPLIADHLLDKCQFTSSVLIISPLQSLMIDQVAGESFLLQIPFKTTVFVLHLTKHIVSLSGV
eukprot:gene5808-6506_t